MFGVRITSLFTSRWMALAWAVLICLTAIQFVGSGKGGGNADKNGSSAQSSRHEGQDAPDPADAETRKDVESALKALD